MRRDTDALHERMDAIIRVAKAIKRTSATTPAVPEEAYDDLHAETCAAYEVLAGAWRHWAELLPRTAASPDSGTAE